MLKIYIMHREVRKEKFNALKGKHCVKSEECGVQWPCIINDRLWCRPINQTNDWFMFMLLYLFIYCLSLNKFLIIQWLIAAFLLNIWTASWESDYAMQIHNTLSARACKALKLKTGNSLKKRRWKTYLWTQTRIHCTWQQKLVHFIIDKQTQEGGK